jgi:hypothetical protein
MLLVSGFGNLVKTITAFTVAHSVTLALATLGFVHVPSAPTEAVIALSIVFVAAEVLRDGDSLTRRQPWSVALVFGLFHGLGFAGALSQIGVPDHEVPLALFMFNVGVEAGQLMFVAVVFGLLAVVRRVRGAGATLPVRVPAYAIGGLAAYWTIERVVTFLPV